MAHLAKYSLSQCGQLFAHTERTRELEAYSNDKIDTARTHLNASFSDKKGMEQLQTRLNEVSHLKRKDLNVVCSWIITLPQSLTDAPVNAQNAFFSHANDFLEQRYGKENKICSKAHFDETTPHLHYAFCPVVQGRKGLRISAREVINKKELQIFHTDLDRFMKEKMLEYKGDLLNRATREGNQTILELKCKTAQLELENLEFKTADLLKTPFSKDEIKEKKPLFSNKKEIILTEKQFDILSANYNDNQKNKKLNKQLNYDNEHLIRTFEFDKKKINELEKENLKLNKVIAIFEKFISFSKLEEKFKAFFAEITKPKEQKIEKEQTKERKIDDLEM